MAKPIEERMRELADEMDGLPAAVDQYLCAGASEIESLRTRLADAEKRALECAASAERQSHHRKVAEEENESLRTRLAAADAERDEARAAIAKAHAIVARGDHGYPGDSEALQDDLDMMSALGSMAARLAARLRALAQPVGDERPAAKRPEVVKADEIARKWLRGELTLAEFAIDASALLPLSKTTEPKSAELPSRRQEMDEAMEKMRAISKRIDDASREGCQHVGAVVEFDAEQARGLTPQEVRERWPRFFGTCPDCGNNLIKYASAEHYIAGDW